MKADEIDLTHLFSLDVKPYWIITRWFQEPENVCDAEREEAAKSDITDFEDFGAGLLYNSHWDGMTVADNMVRRFGKPFGVVEVAEAGVKLRIIYVSG